MDKNAGLREYLKSIKSLFKQKNCLSGACKAQDVLAKRGIKSRKIVSLNPALHILLKTDNGSLISYHKHKFRLLKKFKPKAVFDPNS